MDPSQVAQLYPPEYLEADRSRQLLNVAIAFGVLEGIFFILFFYSRLKYHIRSSLDIYLVVLGFLFVFMHVVVDIVSVKYCAAGRHVVVATKGEINTWLKGAFVEELVYYPSVSFPKLAILCLYLRIFTTRFYRYSAHICAWIIISSIVVFIIVSLTACKPLAFKWNKTIQGHCIDQVASYRYVSLPNLITDLIILILPHPVIWHLHTGRIQKVALTITFLTGSIGIVTAIMRFVFYLKTNVFEDITWHTIEMMTWNTIEPGMYFIAAVLPSLRPLFKDIFHNIDVSTLGSRLLLHRREQHANHTKIEKNNTGPASQRDRFGFRKLLDKKNHSSIDSSNQLVTFHQENDRSSNRTPESKGEISGSGILVRKDVTLSSSLK